MTAKNTKCYSILLHIQELQTAIYGRCQCVHSRIIKLKRMIISCFGGEWDNFVLIFLCHAHPRFLVQWHPLLSTLQNSGTPRDSWPYWWWDMKLWSLICQLFIVLEFPIKKKKQTQYIYMYTCIHKIFIVHIKMHTFSFYFHKLFKAHFCMWCVCVLAVKKHTDRQ